MYINQIILPGEALTFELCCLRIDAIGFFCLAVKHGHLLWGEYKV
jgi:hypothetical protein